MPLVGVLMNANLSTLTLLPPLFCVVFSSTMNEVRDIQAPHILLWQVVRELPARSRIHVTRAQLGLPVAPRAKSRYASLLSFSLCSGNQMLWLLLQKAGTRRTPNPNLYTITHKSLKYISRKITNMTIAKQNRKYFVWVC